jgi:hypothetical protein
MSALASPSQFDDSKPKNGPTDPNAIHASQSNPDVEHQTEECLASETTPLISNSTNPVVRNTLAKLAKLRTVSFSDLPILAAFQLARLLGVDVDQLRQKLDTARQHFSSRLIEPKFLYDNNDSLETGTLQMLLQELFIAFFSTIPYLMWV